MTMIGGIQCVRKLAMGIALAVAVVSVSPAGAVNSLKYSGFSQLVTEIKDMMLTHCRKRGNLDATGIYGPLTEPNTFRQACGQGLNGTDSPTAPWKFFYTIEGNDTGTMDVMGIQRMVEVNGKQGSLVLGWETRRAQPHQEPEISSGQSMAVLFVDKDGSWEPVWAFANGQAKTWNRAWDWKPEDINWTDWTVPDLETVWSEYVTKGAANFVWNVKDTRGVGFP